MPTESTRRITPDVLLAAIEKTGIKPKRDDFCCCGLAVVARCEGVEDTARPLGRRGEINTWSYEMEDWLDLNFDTRYPSGFMNGFDQSVPRQCDDPYTQGYADYRPSYTQGYDDGRACAAAVFGDNTPERKTTCEL